MSQATDQLATAAKRPLRLESRSRLQPKFVELPPAWAASCFIDATAPGIALHPRTPTSPRPNDRRWQRKLAILSRRSANDDPAASATITINDVNIVEGNVGTKLLSFAVILNRPVATGAISVDYLVTEANETFFMNLSAPVNATIFDAQGQATLVNDD